MKICGLTKVIRQTAVSCKEGDHNTMTANAQARVLQLVPATIPSYSKT